MRSAVVLKRLSSTLIQDEMKPLVCRPRDLLRPSAPDGAPIPVDGREGNPTQGAFRGEFPVSDGRSCNSNNADASVARFGRLPPEAVARGFWER